MSEKKLPKEYQRLCEKARRYAAKLYKPPYRGYVAAAYLDGARWMASIITAIAVRDGATANDVIEYTDKILDPISYEQ